LDIRGFPGSLQGRRAHEADGGVVNVNFDWRPKNNVTNYASAEGTAMSDKSLCTAMPLDISSRSESVNASLARRRAAGRLEESVAEPKLILHPPVVIRQPPQTGTKEVRTCLQ
jgi:hypothetical protein